MSRFDWVNIAKGAFLAALFAVLLWFIATDLMSRSRWYEQDASERSQEYTDQANREIASRCDRLIPTEQIRCTSEAKQAERENQRDEQDLAAQKITAWWTEVMALAAIIGMAVSVVGVFLVWTTFRETRASNEIARGVALSDTRPILSYAGIEWSHPGDTLNWRAHFRWVNVGKGPAKLVSLELDRQQLEHMSKPDVEAMFDAFEAKQSDPMGLIVGASDGHRSTEIAVTPLDFEAQGRKAADDGRPERSDVYLLARAVYVNPIAGGREREFTTRVAVKVMPLIEGPKTIFPEKTPEAVIAQIMQIESEPLVLEQGPLDYRLVGYTIRHADSADAVKMT